MPGRQLQSSEPPTAHTFPLFHLFPPEIRLLIWSHAIPDDVSELYILQSYQTRPGDRLPSVHTAFPALMHVCQEARAYVQSRLSLRFSPEARCAVPCRDFRPDLDIFFIPTSSFGVFFTRPEYFFGDLTSKLHHIAIDVALTTNEIRLIEVFHHLKSLRSVTLLFGQARGPHQAGTMLTIPPVRRCRARPFTEDELCEKIRSSVRPVWTTRVSKYLAMYYVTLEKVASSLPPNVDISVWDRQAQRLKLQIKAQVFVEYRRGFDEKPEWAELGRAMTQQVV